MNVRHLMNMSYDRQYDILEELIQTICDTYYEDDIKCIGKLLDIGLTLEEIRGLNYFDSGVVDSYWLD